MLDDTGNSTSTTKAATANSVKQVKDGSVSKTVSTVSGDLNTYTTTGLYFVPASTTNAPDTLTYNLIVTSNGTNVTQTALRLNSNLVGVWTRNSINNGSTWSTWVRGLTTGDLTSAPSNSTTTALTPNTLFTLGFIDVNFSIAPSASAVDLNTQYANTVFKYLTGTLTNAPTGVSVPIYLYQARLNSTTDYIQHLWTNEATPRYFMRAKTANVWGNWVLMVDSTMLATKVDQNNFLNFNRKARMGGIF
jgi:hypothetical protein